MARELNQPLAVIEAMTAAEFAHWLAWLDDEARALKRAQRR